MKKISKKKLLVIVIVVAAAVVGCVLGVKHQRNSRTAQVTPVSDLSDSYWGDEVYSSGQIRNDQTQSVYVEKDSTIKEVYVEEGQEVEVGDKLLTYDTTSAELDYKMKELEVEKLKNDLSIAQNELKKLKSTKPVSEQTQEQTSVITPQVQEKTGNAYNYVSESAEPYNASEADGSAENPYRFLCADGAYVTGEMLAKLAEDGSCAVFEVYAGNQVSGEPEYSWSVDGSMITVPDPGTKWDIATRSQVVDEVEPAEDDTSNDTQPEGYTQAELNELISEKEQEISKLDLSKRKAELEVEKLKQSGTDGIVYATVKGTVKNLQDKDNLPTDGTAFLEVAGSEGLYVTGQVSELLLDDIEPGETTVQVMSWESGISCEATIMEVSDYPASETTSYGSGNPNVSYYPYTAYIEDTSGLKNGEYVDLTMTVGGDESGDAIYLTKAYVRTENGQSYVYKADENGRLVKQYVETGKLIYGYEVEIKSGLTLDDRIAFPYGKTAKEGLRVTDAASDEEM